MHEKAIFRTVRPWAAGRRRLAVLCAAGGAALLAAGCSSSGGASSAGAASSTGAAASSAVAAAAPSGAAAGCVAAATARANAARAPMTLGAIDKADASAMKGKTFAVIPGVEGSDTLPEINAAQQALAAAGAKSLVLNGHGLPDVIAQAFQTAVTEHVAAIVTLGIDPSVFPAGYAVAKAAGIPVVAANDGNPQEPLAGGVSSLVTVNQEQLGTVQADYALAQSGCKLHAVFVYTKSAVLNVDGLNGVTAEVKRLCPPGDCSVDPLNLDAATFPTTLPGQVSTTLQHTPGINYLISATDTFVSYILQGRNALGSTVPLVGAVGDALAPAIVGDGQTADVVWPPDAEIGYYFAGALMDAAAGAPKNVTLPVRLLDPGNWGTDADTARAQGQAGYQADFEKAWGLQG